MATSNSKKTAPTEPTESASQTDAVTSDERVSTLDFGLNALPLPKAQPKRETETEDPCVSMVLRVFENSRSCSIDTMCLLFVGLTAGGCRYGQLPTALDRASFQKPAGEEPAVFKAKMVKIARMVKLKFQLNKCGFFDWLHVFVVATKRKQQC